MEMNNCCLRAEVSNQVRKALEPKQAWTRHSDDRGNASWQKSWTPWESIHLNLQC